MEINGLLESEKLVIALVSAIIALIFSQLVLYAKYVYNKFRIKRALLDELNDVDNSLDSAVAICRHKLMMNVKMMHEGSMPISIGTYIFDSYYKDVASDLSSTQRRSYQLIHHYIQDINESIEHLTKKNREASEAYFIHPESVDQKFQKLWFDRLASFYEVLCITRWHIHHHLKNKHNPELPYDGPVYDDYTTLKSDIQEAIKELIKEAQDMSTQELESQKVRL
ncbi:hypothetical protein BCT40_16420 [Vibrio lentus]|uniref:hypothetical protein n=1 Tax=Vibrio lentus TaxID=136468 RepID=UPI000C8213B9|nr:hypothetical protein [Vibrio lentus]MCC4857562.1 hypothetical protein [Vibrio lentus]PME60645.1 hypothetical protein BCV33_04370 [Vibrio lentus]PMG57293.1 hypothetical protein BCU87_02535 [Vibrio lentus]PMN05824.1 hypothetical protein BCT40_16420 [Vibrio lentus]TKF40756.1 hypothetical protein FCV64_20140 [Vibrio lentus]